MGWVWVVLAVGCLAVAALHLARLAGRAGEPLDELAHATMALGMAAMFAPAGDPLSAPAWTIAFVLTGAWFGAVALRARSAGGDAAHHVVGSAAMLFMLANGHGAADPAAVGDHAGHHGGAGGGVGLVSVVAIVLAGYFAWHALRCSDRFRLAGEAPAAAAAGTTAVAARTGLLRSVQAVALAHVVMAVAMTVMLLALV